jgi:hypothetical protein
VEDRGFRLRGRNSASFHARVVVAILWHVWGFGVGFSVEFYVCEVGAGGVVIGLLRCRCGFRAPVQVGRVGGC